MRIRETLVDKPVLSDNQSCLMHDFILPQQQSANDTDIGSLPIPQHVLKPARIEGFTAG